MIELLTQSPNGGTNVQVTHGDAFEIIYFQKLAARRVGPV